MKPNLSAFRTLLVLTTILLPRGILWSQVQEPIAQQPIIQEPIPGETTTSSTRVPESASRETIEKIQAKIKELESTQDIDDEVNAKALELYRQALTRFEAAATYVSKAAAFKAAIESAPKEIERITLKLSQPSVPPGEGINRDVPPNLTATDVEQLLAKEQANLLGLKSQLEQWDQQITEQQVRPDQARRQLADAKQKLEEIRSEPTIDIPPDENPLLTEARTVSLTARKQSRTDEIEFLEQELLSHPIRLDLLKARRDLLARQVATAEDQIKVLQDRYHRLRREEAARVQAETERAQREASGKHSAIRELAETNANMSLELSGLAQRVEQIIATKQSATTQREQIQKEFKSTQEKLDVAGLSDVLGQILREDRRELPDLWRYRRGAAIRKKQIAEAGLRYLQVESDRQKLADSQAQAERIVALLGDLSEAERADVQVEIQKLLVDQKGLLEKLADAYNRYLSELGDLDFEEHQLIDQASQYASFLDERLLWIPSGTWFDLDALADAGSALAWLIQVEHWSQTAWTLWDEVTRFPIVNAIVLLMIISLILSQRKILAQLEIYAGRVGKIYADSFWLTLAALGLTIILVTAWPLLMGWIAWLLFRSIEGPAFAKAVGAGLAGAAQLLAASLFLRAFCQKNNGVGEAHLRWRRQTTSLLRKHLFWMECLAIPAVFITLMTEWSGHESYRQSLGRLAFIAAMLGLSAFVGLILRPQGGVADQVLTRNPNGWLSRLRYVWYVMAVGLPLVLAILAVRGYYYTAQELTHRMLATVVVIVVAVVGHELFMRWLFVAHRKLAVAKAREKREMELRQSGDQASGDGSKDVALELPEVDLATIDAQTRHLLRAVVTVWVVIGLWMVWADVVPALSMLDKVSLWQHSVMVDGHESLEPITLASLALAVVIAMATVAAARNLPGVLEIAVLQHLPLDSGSRYAITTVSRYLITTVGVVIAFNVLGVGWSHVQWLVAALGVGLGFGLQEIFANFVSGLIILLERPIRVGDTVTVGDVSGTVSRIQIRATTITDWDRKELIVPNKSFITDRLVNWTLSDPITRLIIKVGVAYGSDTDLAQRLMYEAARKTPSVLEEPEPAVLFLGFGESSLDYEVRIFVAELTNRGRSKILHNLHMRIDKTFREHGVVIAFPQRDVHMYHAQADSDPSSNTAGQPSQSDVEGLDTQQSTP